MTLTLHLPVNQHCSYPSYCCNVR